MKTYQRILASVGIVLLVASLVMGMLVAVARSARVQTAVVGVVAEQLSRGLGARVEVGQLNYKFPNHLLVEDVLIEDRQADTLLFVDTLSAQLSILRLFTEDTLAVRRLCLHGAYVNAYQQPDGEMNYRFLTDAFRSDDTDTAAFPIQLQISDISLERIRVHYCDWDGQLSQANLHLRTLSADCLDAEIERLALTAEHSGTPFAIDDLSARLIVTDSIISLPQLRLRMPQSDMAVEHLTIDRSDALRIMQAAPSDSAARAAAFASTEVSLRIDDMTLTPYDLRALFPQCASMRSPWSLSAGITGRVDSLALTDLTVRFRSRPVLTGEATVLALPSMDSLYMRVRCTDLTTNRATLQDILSNLTGKPVRLPDLVGRLGQIHYRGLLEGRLEHLTLRGALSTALGSIRTDGTATAASDFSTLHYDGQLSTTRFQLGRLLAVDDLGTVAFSIRTDGDVIQDQTFHGDVQGKVNHITYRDYTYRDITLDGCFRDHVFTGHLASADPNIDFIFDGRLNLTRTAPQHAFTLVLHHFRPGPLHLSERYADADLSLLLKTDMSGASLDDLEGTIRIDRMQLTRTADTLLMRSLLLQADHQGDHRALHLYSDYINAGLSGRFSYSTLLLSLQRRLCLALPHLFPDAERRRLLAERPDNQLSLYVYGSSLQRISEVLGLAVSVPDQPTIKGELSDRAGTASLQLLVPSLHIGERHIDNVTAALSAEGDRMRFSFLTTARHTSNKASQLIGDMTLLLSAQAVADSLTLSADWANPDTVHNAGSVRMAASFARYADRPLITTRIRPSELLISDSLWTIDPANIVYNAADTLIRVDHFRIGSATQHIFADGVASTRVSDSIYVALQDINLDYLLNSFTPLHQTIWFGGRVTGWATAYGVLSSPMFEANVRMLDASINGSPVGDVYAAATLDRASRHVLIQGEAFDRRLPYAPASIDTCLSRSAYTSLPLDYSFYQSLPDSVRRSGRHVVHLDGEVGGAPGQWGLRIFPDSVDLGFVEHWTSTFLTDFSGRGSGQVYVGGDRVDGQPRTIVLLRAIPHDLGVTIPFTGGRYFVSDSIFMDTTSISFPHLTLHDAEQHPIMLDGAVTHSNFTDFHFDIEVDAHKALVLNLPNDGSLFGGHVYADGHVDIHGDEHLCSIVARAATTGGSFFLNVASASSASDNSFITFVDHSPVRAVEPATVDDPFGMRLSLSLFVDVTSNVDVSVLLDQHTGDRIRGRGEGSLRLNLLDDDLTLHGTYTLHQGTFGFTFQNVIRREFLLADGSSVTWSGDPENPALAVDARYRLTASLRDLFGQDASSITSRSSVPVNCVLHLTDHLSSPIISFGIELPSSDESVASQVRSVINTDEMLMRQVLYLLVFNRFYTPEYLQNTANVGLNETYSLLSSTLTGQINSWLSRLTDVVTLGFNFRTDGEGASSSQEYEAQFEIHPVRGLVLNGNLGYRYNDISNQPIFGNLDIEYMLTPNGKLRAKAFTHTVDKYSLRQANTVQGVGLVVRHDFNWPDSAARAQSREQRAERRAARHERSAQRAADARGRRADRAVRRDAKRSR